MKYPVATFAQKADVPYQIDLRSDTVTQPSSGMRKAMAEAIVGDDVYGEDPSIVTLENRLANLCNKEAGLFFPTGTQSNLCALLSHCQRGDEILVGRDYHIYSAESGGISILGGVAMDPLPVMPDGSVSVQSIAMAIKAKDIHFPKTRLLCLENTVTGRAVPQALLDEAAIYAHEQGLRTHLDGARLFNASIALDCSIDELSRNFDSVSLCLSKGLGAPAGSVLVGSEEFIEIARRNRKLTGGGMRQAGVLAAAALHALDHNICELERDHQKARQLSRVLDQHPNFQVEKEGIPTNMIRVRLVNMHGSDLAAHLAKQGIRIASGATELRLVFHRDISAENTSMVIDAFSQIPIYGSQP